MHDAHQQVAQDEPTHRDAPRARRRRRRRALDPAPYLRLFRMLRSFHAASPEALDVLFFQQAFPKQSGRTTYRMIASLVEEGYLAKMRLPYARVLYHLTRKSLAALSSAGITAADTLRRPPSVTTGGRDWLRTTMCAALARLGFTVGRNGRAAYALRRELIDGNPGADKRVLDAVRADPLLNPWAQTCRACGFSAGLDDETNTCPKCKRDLEPVLAEALFVCPLCETRATAPGIHGDDCDEPMDELDVLPFDVAWRRVGKRYEVRVLIVEDPNRSLASQLDELRPLKHAGAAKVPLVLRSTDPDSRFDRKTATWVVKGTRHQQLERAFSEKGYPGFFTFARTTALIDVRPDIQLHIMRSGALPPAWECGVPWGGREGGRLGGRLVQEHEGHLHERDERGVHERERDQRVREREMIREERARGPEGDPAQLRREQATAEAAARREHERAAARERAVERVAPAREPVRHEHFDWGGGRRR